MDFIQTRVQAETHMFVTSQKGNVGMEEKGYRDKSTQAE